ncbi:MAG: hypothetical protein PHS41_10290 [Victivallaceae bacterium]|nr:hypothetical protein [Victivallaceae bacterium]
MNLQYVFTAGLICTVCSSFGAPIRLSPVDRFGQAANENWPGKITEEQEMRRQAETEEKALSHVKIDLTRFDRFGGRLDAGKYPATGSFYTQKINGRWHLVTPDGHLFFMISSDTIKYDDLGYQTPVTEVGGKPRKEISELPDRQKFPEAYIERSNKNVPLYVSFLTANLKRKYGENFHDRVLNMTRKRLLSWGFNSTGKWCKGVTVDMPYIDDWTLEVRRISRSRIDVFAPDFPKRAEASIIEQTKRCKNDPMLIAFSCENENGWERCDVLPLTGASADSPAKAALVDFLIERHGEKKAAELFGLPDKNKEAMMKNKKVVDLPRDDCRQFIIKASTLYHKTVRALYRKHAPDKMWFGASFNGAMDWGYAALPHLDAVMFNEYDIDARWLGDLLNQIKKRDKPVIVSEFSHVCEGRGFRLYNNLNTVKDTNSRGLAYRHFTEKLASDPFFIGLCFFMFYDDPILMTAVPIGENCNFGLVDITDRPYTQMIEHIKKSNARLFDLHQGKMARFKLEYPYDLLARKQFDDLTGTVIPHSVSLPVAVDLSPLSENSQKFARRLYLAKHLFDHYGRKSKRHSTGTIELAGLPQAGEVSADVFLKKGCSNREPERYFDLEAAGMDGKFSPVPLTFQKIDEGDFTHWKMTNRQALPAGSRYVRFILISNAKMPQANQIAGIKVEPRKGPAKTSK